MQLKKQVIEKRLQAQLDRIAEKRKAHWALFPDYKIKHIEACREHLARLEQAETWGDWDRTLGPNLPVRPYYRDYYDSDKEKQIRRNLTILAAIEGRTIEVTALKTGRGLSLETIFDEE